MTKKEKIIETATDLFATVGYENTSIQMLAEKAGVAQGLLYRHFKNKEALLMHLLGMGIEQIQKTLEPYHNEALSFDEAFEQHIKLTCKFLRSHTKLWKVIHSARLQQNMSNDENNEMIRTIIIKPIAAKLKTTAHKEPEIYSWYIFSLIDGMTSLYLSHPDLYPLNKIEKFLVNKLEIL